VKEQPQPVASFVSKSDGTVEAIEISQVKTSGSSTDEWK